MYREKLEKQIVELEYLQSMCVKDHPEVALAVSDKILSLAKQLDQYDAGNSQVFITIDGEKIVIPNTPEK